MNNFTKTVFFVSSYAPLLILFAVLESFGGGRRSLILAVVAFLSIALMGIIWWIFSSTSATDFGEFNGARSRDGDVMAYLVSYVVPFAAATDRDDEATRLALLLFAIIMAVLYIRSAVFYVHPLLLMAGVHVFEATRNDVSVLVLTRQPQLRQQCSLRVVTIAPNVYLETRK